VTFAQPPALIHGIRRRAMASDELRFVCPLCLWSKHVDRDGPGDRLSPCQGLLAPTAVDYDGKKGYVIEYECLACGKTSRNKAAPDDDVIGFSALMSDIDLKS
jgi:hypothetical protein